jgi:hypothetical protein
MMTFAHNVEVPGRHFTTDVALVIAVRRAVSRFLAGSFPRLAHSKAHRKTAGAASYQFTKDKLTTGPRRSHGLRRMYSARWKQLCADCARWPGIASIVKLDGIGLPTCARSIFHSSQSFSGQPVWRSSH